MNGWTLPPSLTGDDDAAIGALRKYFGLDSGTPYTGAFFERLDRRGDVAPVANVITASDLLAVTTLSVEYPAQASIDILGTDSGRLSAWLVAIPTDVDLVDAPDDYIDNDSPANQLWSHLVGYRDVSWVKAGKLLARKRPRLIPVYDRHVKAALNAEGSFWLPLRDLLADHRAEMHHHLLDLRGRAEIGDDISAIRVFDIVCWMHREP